MRAGRMLRQAGERQRPEAVARRVLLEMNRRVIEDEIHQWSRWAASRKEKP